MRYLLDANIPQNRPEDRAITAQLYGGNVDWVFTRGTVTVGTWEKTDATAPTRYLDADGNDILLTPGKTWVAYPYDSVGSSFG